VPRRRTRSARKSRPKPGQTIVNLPARAAPNGASGLLGRDPSASRSNAVCALAHFSKALAHAFFRPQPARAFFPRTANDVVKEARQAPANDRSTTSARRSSPRARSRAPLSPRARWLARASDFGADCIRHRDPSSERAMLRVRQSASRGRPSSARRIESAARHLAVPVLPSSPRDVLRHSTSRAELNQPQQRHERAPRLRLPSRSGQPLLAPAHGAADHDSDNATEQN